MHIHICICICIHIHIRVLAYIYMHIHMRICIYTSKRTFACVYIYIYLDIYIERERDTFSIPQAKQTPLNSEAQLQRPARLELLFAATLHQNLCPKADLREVQEVKSPILLDFNTPMV